MAKSYIEYLKEILASQEETKKQKIFANDTEYEGLKGQVKSDAKKSISETNASYGALVDMENVRRLINERKISESIANMGLTDSGLNRTQQTAVELSHSNKVSGLFAQRRAQVDAIKLRTEQKLQELEGKRIQFNSTVENSFLEAAQKTASDLYNDDITAEAKAKEAELKKQIEALKEEKKALEKNQKEPEAPNTSYEEESEGEPDMRQWYVDQLYSGLHTRKELAQERKLDKNVPSYEEYLRENFDSWYYNGKITKKEYGHLVNKYLLRA